VLSFLIILNVDPGAWTVWRADGRGQGVEGDGGGLVDDIEARVGEGALDITVVRTDNKHAD